MRRALRLILPLLMLVTLSCQSGADDDVDAAQSEETSMQEWSIVVRSSGGITGRGDGSVSLTSGGLLERTTPGGTVCRETISSELLAGVDRALVEAEPGDWKNQYFQQGADFFEYTMTLEIGETEQQIVEWNDGADLPADLRKLWSALNAARQSIDCREAAQR